LQKRQNHSDYNRMQHAMKRGNSGVTV
jgi:hypothetical protein